MRRSKSKKGISPVVASVLLVVLVLILASIIFIWAKGFIGERISKDDKPVSQICDVTSFSVNLVETATPGIYEASIVNNGNYPLFGFLVLKEYGGNSLKQDIGVPVAPQGNIRQNIDLRINTHPPTRVTFYPLVLGTVDGENRPYTCMDSGLEKQL